MIFLSHRFKRRFFLLSIVVLLLSVACWIVWKSWGMGELVFNPQPSQQDKRYDNWDSSRRIFESDGERLEGWFLENKRKPLLVFCAGRGRDTGSYLKTFSSWPVAKLLVNYRGFGTSTGRPTEQNVVEDTIFIIETILKETNRTWSQVVLVGNSLGTGVVARIAARKQAGRVVLCVPFDRFGECAARFVPAGIVSFLFGDTFRSDQYAAQIKSPVSILAATYDQDIPVEQARRLRTRFRNVHYHEFETGHESIWHDPDFLNELRQEVEFLKMERKDERNTQKDA